MLHRPGNAPTAFYLAREAAGGGQGCLLFLCRQRKTHGQCLDLAYLRQKRPQASLQCQSFASLEADSLCPCPCWEAPLSLCAEESCVLPWTDTRWLLTLKIA